MKMIRVTVVHQFEPKVDLYPEGSTEEDIIEIERTNFDEGIIDLDDLDDKPLMSWEVIDV